MKTQSGSAHPFENLVDLAVVRNGGQVVQASDDFFAPKEQIIALDEPVFKPGVYTDRGKWMDGWESRRRRGPGNDWCIVKLGFRGRVKGVDIDTRHFVGNHPPEASIEMADEPDANGDPPHWLPLLPRRPLAPDTHNLFETHAERCCTQVRLNIFPDGGVARLRVYGVVEPDWSSISPGEVVELSSLKLGGFPVACNNEHFGRMMNLLRTDAPANMGDGWETRRRRVPGYDWFVVRLGTSGLIERIVVDTTYFKGNFPDRCSVEGCRCPKETDPAGEMEWTGLIPETKLHGHQVHVFDDVRDHGPFSHLRLNIYPDGGVARFRAYGRVVRP